MAEIPVVTDQTFQERVTESARLTVVDFWASWCMPCRMLGPILEKVAEKNTAKADFYKLNTDENPKIAAQFRIMSIPTVIFFRNGQEVRRVVGVQQETAFQREIDQV